MTIIIILSEHAHNSIANLFYPPCLFHAEESCAGPEECRTLQKISSAFHPWLVSPYLTPSPFPLNLFFLHSSNSTLGCESGNKKRRQLAEGLWKAAGESPYLSSHIYKCGVSAHSPFWVHSPPEPCGHPV